VSIDAETPAAPAPAPSPLMVLREWGRIGVTGFGGPPAHIALLRALMVSRTRWMDARAFEDANAACSLLPGPASTQLAILCAYRVAGPAGAIVGGLAFIVPAVALILPLAALFLAHAAPLWMRGAGAGAGAAVAAVAVQAARGLIGPSFARAREKHGRRARWSGYLLAGTVAAALIGPYLVFVLLGCGLIELVLARRSRPVVGSHFVPSIALVRASMASGGIGALGWTALKVGALSFGGGFVIIPLMQADATSHHWMTSAQFLNGIALGQITPGPVVQTVATVGYAAAGFGGGLLAALVAFSPSFAFVLGGARYFGALRGSQRAQSFLDGVGPAAIGAILGSAVPLTGALTQPWQYIVLAAAAILLLGLRRGVVLTLLAAAAAGVIVALAGGPLPP
jgi:chromate transporter